MRLAPREDHVFRAHDRSSGLVVNADRGTSKTMRQLSPRRRARIRAVDSDREPEERVAYGPGLLAAHKPDMSMSASTT
jgi:hypothetical protein